MPGGNPGGNNNDPEPNNDFNNPNITFSVKFKNKVKNNNFEFIMTIQPESNKKGFYKQFKVKRNLYEFQELFNHLESVNPQDRILRQIDYNQMFGSTNEGNMYMLEDFVNSIISKENQDKKYLLNKKVQEFLQITDP